MLFAALAVATALQAPADPLAPARQGQVECFGFDTARKTCRAIGAYRFTADGTIFNDAANLVNAEPSVVMRTSSPVYVKDGAECTRVAPMRDQITVIEVNGTRLEGEQFTAVRDQLAAALDGLFPTGSEFCGRYEAQPDGSVMQRLWVDGVAQPDKDDAFRWVDPAEGWRVAP